MYRTVRAAAIDIGSNSVRLLLADVRPDSALQTLAKRIESTRISEGMGCSRCLSDEAMARTMGAVARFYRDAQEQGAERLYAFATAAVRDATNGGAFIAELGRQTGIALHVLSEQEEALVGFVGANAGGPCGVIDIGGGSTELVVGEGRVPRASVSMRMGAVYLSERYPLGDIADPLGLEAMAQTADSILHSDAGPIRDALRGAPVQWVGLGGTITSLAAMDLRMARYDRERIQGYALSRETVGRWRDRLARMGAAERTAIPGLAPERADIILAGVVILDAFLAHFGIDALRVSDRDNLEGYLLMRVEQEYGAKP
ncbi:MAG: Ppx/GppA family phosphatase [Christensenellales bacterium]